MQTVKRIEGIPVSQIAEILNLTSNAVKQRLHQRGIRPITYLGTAGLYTEETIEQIRVPFPRGTASTKHPGRPRLKNRADETAEV